MKNSSFRRKENDYYIHSLYCDIKRLKQECDSLRKYEALRSKKGFLIVKSVECLRLVGLLRNPFECSHFFDIGNIDEYCEVLSKKWCPETTPIPEQTSNHYHRSVVISEQLSNVYVHTFFRVVKEIDEREIKKGTTLYKTVKVILIAKMISKIPSILKILNVTIFYYILSLKMNKIDEFQHFQAVFIVFLCLC